MLVELSWKLLNEYNDKGYRKIFKQAFTALPEDVGFNNDLSAPKPNFVEGLEIREYYPFQVDKYIDGAVLYEDDPHSLALPHLVGEWKARGKDMEKAKLKSAYDGAALAYAQKPGSVTCRDIRPIRLCRNYDLHYGRH
jgi:hypothetical protein